MEQKLNEQYLVEVGTCGDLLILRTLHNPENDLVVCLINVSDKEIVVKAGQALTQATTVGNCSIPRGDISEPHTHETGKYPLTSKTCLIVLKNIYGKGRR